MTEMNLIELIDGFFDKYVFGFIDKYVFGFIDKYVVGFIDKYVVGFIEKIIGFVDKHIFGSSPSKSTDNNGVSSSLKKKQEISPSYDFQPNPSSSLLRSNNNSVGDIEADRIIGEKAQKTNGSEILSEVDGTMKRYIDNLLHSIDGISARLSHLEHSVDELKASVGNNHGSADGKMRQLQVEIGVQDLKDKQDVMESQMNLFIQQISKAMKLSGVSNAVQPDHMQKKAVSAPRHPALQQFSMAPLSQHTIHFPPGPQQDAYFIPHNQTQDAPSQQYQMPPSPLAQQLQQPFAFAPPPQQHQSTSVPLYPQPPQPPQQQYMVIVRKLTENDQSVDFHVDE